MIGLGPAAEALLPVVPKARLRRDGRRWPVVSKTRFQHDGADEGALGAPNADQSPLTSSAE